MKITNQPIEVEVTADDIKNGEKCSSRLCPIALAIHRMGYSPLVDAETVEIKKGLEYYIPTEAQKFIMDFDSGEEVEPFTFELSEVSYADDNEDENEDDCDCEDCSYND